jgi:serine protease
MQPAKWIAAFVLVSILSYPGAVGATTDTETAETPHAADHVLVKLTQGATSLRLLDGATDSGVDGWMEVPVPEGQSPDQVVADLEQDPAVEAAHVDPIIQLDPTSPVKLDHVSPTSVNDPGVGFQWHLSALGLSDVWSQTSGDGVVVAIIDSGVSTAGEDLDCHAFVSPYNAILDTTGMAAASDDNGHGTHVAGTVAQCTNNGVGVAGVAFDASLMPVKVLGSSGSGPTSALARGIVWAHQHGADVINLSLGCTDCANQMADEAIESAVADGVVIVAASGNDGDNEVSYPASHPDVIAVGATDYNNLRAYYSNGGSALDLVAPGGDLDQDANGDTYGDGVLQESRFDDVWGYYFSEGTSMAAPHVSGVVALLLAAYPEFDRGSVEHVLEETALDLGPGGFDISYGHGFVQIHSALLFDLVAPVWGSESEISVDEFGQDSFRVSWGPASDNKGVTAYRVTLGGTVVSTQPGRQITLAGLEPGSVYAFEVEARDAVGNWSDVLAANLRTARFFFDTVGHLFDNDIDWLSGMDVTRGCNPPVNDLFCPDDPVTRGQMAAFLVRALGLTADTHPGFVDVGSSSTFVDDIGKLATAGITRGCNPPGNDRFCPDDSVTRAQMASFLVRALGLTADTHPGFVDVGSSSTFVDDIGKLATAGITLGCNPPDNDRFCPDQPVTRGQLAAFLKRALG